MKVLIATIVAAVAAGAAGAATTTTATVRLVAHDPATVGGRGFHARERVRVTYGEEKAEYAKVVRASATGTLRAVFTGVEVGDPCNVRIVAVGAAGSRAAWKLPPRMCLPGP